MTEIIVGGSGVVRMGPTWYVGWRIEPDGTITKTFSRSPKKALKKLEKRKRGTGPVTEEALSAARLIRLFWS